MDTIRLSVGAPGRQRTVVLVVAAIESVDFDTMTVRTLSGDTLDLTHDGKAWQELLSRLGVDSQGNPPQPWAGVG
jgi:hypothetical protein